MTNIQRNLALLLLFSALVLAGCNQKTVPERELYLFDMVHHNPGDAPTVSKFNDPKVLAEYGFNGMVVNTFIPPHAAITFESLNKDIFPEGSTERRWVDSMAVVIQNKIRECHEAGIKVYYFTDIIVLPKRLKEIYYDEICNEIGQIDPHRPRTQEIHRLMLQEIFERFPDLDGLVVRTGETYLHNMPYHTGNTPVQKAEQSHIELLNILREEVCEKLDKMVFYRTWDFGFFHTQPDYYLTVTNAIEPHKNLVFSIKHPEGDYHRTFPFNPTIGIGQHPQIIEVQGQREYEGKGAYPNYIGDGVINGFEEYEGHTGLKSLGDFQNSPLFAGVWAWSRGGGWVGPYISNELWCDLNTYALARWTQNHSLSQTEILKDFAARIGVNPGHYDAFAEMCMLTPDAVVRGHNSLISNVNVWWTRDQFFGGLELLDTCFHKIIDKGLTQQVIAEKAECRNIWERVNEIAGQLEGSDPKTMEYIRVSSRYGLLKYSIVEQAWTIMLLGLEGETNGNWQKEAIQTALVEYDRLWAEFERLPVDHPVSANVYKPYAFDFHNPPSYASTIGMKTSVDKFREMIKSL
jgi:hypothetical protein